MTEKLKGWVYRKLQNLWFGNAHNKVYSRWPIFTGTSWQVFDGVKWVEVAPPPMVYDPLTKTYQKVV